MATVISRYFIMLVRDVLLLFMTLVLIFFSHIFAHLSSGWVRNPCLPGCAVPFLIILQIKGEQLTHLNASDLSAL